MKVIEGKLNAKDLKFGIVVGRFNEFISSKLLGGAIDGLKKKPLKWSGHPDHSKFRSLPRRWPNQINMMR
jgi:hypothetical protein